MTDADPATRTLVRPPAGPPRRARARPARDEVRHPRREPARRFCRHDPGAPRPDLPRRHLGGDLEPRADHGRQGGRRRLLGGPGGSGDRRREGGAGCPGAPASRCVGGAGPAGRTHAHGVRRRRHATRRRPPPRQRPAGGDGRSAPRLVGRGRAPRRSGGPRRARRAGGCRPPGRSLARPGSRRVRPRGPPPAAPRRRPAVGHGLRCRSRHRHGHRHRPRDRAGGAGGCSACSRDARTRQPRRRRGPFPRRRTDAGEGGRRLRRPALGTRAHRQGRLRRAGNAHQQPHRPAVGVDVHGRRLRRLRPGREPAGRPRALLRRVGAARRCVGRRDVRGRTRVAGCCHRRLGRVLPSRAVAGTQHGAGAVPGHHRRGRRGPSDARDPSTGSSTRPRSIATSTSSTP